jgi:NAD dependent epimerase/dehydratase family enzyme
MARAAFGEFARKALLSSARVVPQKLIDGDFRFRFPARLSRTS